MSTNENTGDTPLSLLSFAELHSQMLSLRRENQSLKSAFLDLRGKFEELRRNHDEFQKSCEATINRLVVAAEYQDDAIDRHIRRIGSYAAFLADKRGLGQAESRMLELAAPMHDIGKAGVPRSILLKHGKLTDEEFTVMQLHTVIGGNLLAASDSALLAAAREIALSHHECWDGSGYPVGTSGPQIPIAGRIVGLVDAFDALTSRRPHKSPYPVDVACDILYEQRGRKFDPDLVDLLQNSMDVIIRLKAEIDTPENLPNGHFELSERDRG